MPFFIARPRHATIFLLIFFFLLRFAASDQEVHFSLSFFFFFFAKMGQLSFLATSALGLSFSFQIYLYPDSKLKCIPVMFLVSGVGPLRKAPFPFIPTRFPFLLLHVLFLMHDTRECIHLLRASQSPERTILYLFFVPPSLSPIPEPYPHYSHP